MRRDGRITARPLTLVLALVLSAGCSKVADPSGDGERPYAITVTPPAQASMGSPVSAKIRVEPRGGYKINLEYPAKLEVQGPMGTAPMRQVINKGDAVTLNEKELVMAPAVTLGKGGEHRFSGKLSFSVCTDRVCEVKSEQLSWTVKVKE